MKHKILRNNDEYACSCGLTWGLGDVDPHIQPVATANAEARHKALNQIEEILKDET